MMHKNIDAAKTWQFRSWSRHTWLPIIRTMFILTVTITCAEYSMSETQPHAQSKATAYCVGRFNFALPEEVVPGGREQHIYLTKVWTETTTGTDPLQAWAKHLTSIRQPAKPAQGKAIVKEFNLSSVGPAVWYRPSSINSDDRMLLAMKSGQSQALFLETDASAGHEQFAEQLIAAVAAGFVPNSLNGFCVQQGAILLEPSENERAFASFAGGGVEVSVQMETVASPDTSQNGGSDVQGIQTLNRHTRNVADLKGTEERVRITEKNAKPELVYSWNYPGQAADGLHPHIHLQASAPEERRAALDAAWNSLLDSLRRRPTGVR
jgi:hypothetical protein